ncbi:MAG: hypothetical protein NW241_11710 [Bacteroidia bacterium]|nr:hypothetical protein [Bacteroidia bacterium]
MILRIGCAAALVSAALLLPAQELMRSQRIGLYISSRECSYTGQFNQGIAQFLKLEEDRSQEERVKQELIIRLGALLCAQSPQVLGADTMYFLNSDLELGGRFRDAYDPQQRRLRSPVALRGTGRVLVLASMHLDTRIHTSVYARSNRMHTDRIPVRRAAMTLLLFDPGQNTPLASWQLCFDELLVPRRAYAYDFFAGESNMGQFFSRLFTEWHAMTLGNSSGGCE